MKRIIPIILGVMFTGCSFQEQNVYLKITNNTEEKEYITVERQQDSFCLDGGCSIEVECNSDTNLLHCSYGTMSFGKIWEDTTLEINPDCWYLGETKYYY